MILTGPLHHIYSEVASKKKSGSDLTRKPVTSPEVGVAGHVPAPDLKGTVEVVPERETFGMTDKERLQTLVTLHGKAQELRQQGREEEAQHVERAYEAVRRAPEIEAKVKEIEEQASSLVQEGSKLLGEEKVQKFLETGELGEVSPTVAPSVQDWLSRYGTFVAERSAEIQQLRRDIQYLNVAGLLKTARELGLGPDVEREILSAIRREPDEYWVRHAINIIARRHFRDKVRPAIERMERELGQYAPLLVTDLAALASNAYTPEALEKYLREVERFTKGEKLSDYPGRFPTWYQYWTEGSEAGKFVAEVYRAKEEPWYMPPRWGAEIVDITARSLNRVHQILRGAEGRADREYEQYLRATPEYPMHLFVEPHPVYRPMAYGVLSFIGTFPIAYVAGVAGSAVAGASTKAAAATSSLAPKLSAVNTALKALTAGAIATRVGVGLAGSEPIERILSDVATMMATIAGTYAGARLGIEVARHAPFVRVTTIELEQGRPIGRQVEVFGRVVKSPKLTEEQAMQILRTGYTARPPGEMKFEAQKLRPLAERVSPEARITYQGRDRLLVDIGKIGKKAEIKKHIYDVVREKIADVGYPDEERLFLTLKKYLPKTERFGSSYIRQIVSEETLRQLEALIRKEGVSPRVLALIREHFRPGDIDAVMSKRAFTSLYKSLVKNHPDLQIELVDRRGLPTLDIRSAATDEGDIRGSETARHPHARNPVSGLEVDLGKAVRVGAREGGRRKDPVRADAGPLEPGRVQDEGREGCRHVLPV